VQGVGFRSFVHKHAVAHALSGAVRNLFDGRVEILAAGPSAAIADFEKAVSRGPVHAQVDSLEDQNPLGHALALLMNAKGFTVESDGELPWK
jgi:acylphosphatase